MIRDKDLHHESILEAATAEFLKYGFNDASMRRIAAGAYMSASGLYRHFAGKEEMFAAIVEPAYQGLLALFRREESAQRASASADDDWEDGKDASLAIAYMYDHLDAFRLIVGKSQGTKYENYLHDLALLEEEITLSFMDTLKEHGVTLKDFRVKELHLLTTANINAIFQPIEHDFTKEEALHYANTLDRFFAKAWQEFFGY